MERNPLHGRQSLLELVVQVLDPPGHTGFTQRLVKEEGLVQRPPVFKGMETARRHIDGRRERPRRDNLHPHVVRVCIEGRNDGLGEGPGSRMAPYEPRSPRAKHPFVRPSDQKIATHLAQTEILHAEGVNSIDAQDNPVLLRPR